MAEQEEDPEKQRLQDAHAKRKGRLVCSHFTEKGTVPELLTLTANQ